MAKDKEQFGKKEAERRFIAALKGALATQPKPLKSMTPKRPKVQPAKKAKKGNERKA